MYFKNKEIVEREFGSTPSETMAVLLKLQNYVSNEVDLLKTISTSFLTTVCLDNTLHFSEFLGISDRSIAALKEICSALGLSYKLVGQNIFNLYTYL